jgi:hypothetical protein
MGIITDFVVAETAEAKAVLAEAAPTKRWAGVEAKGIETIKLSTLKFILDGKSLDVNSVVAYHSGIKELASRGADGPWVFLVPPELTRQLASLSANDVARVAAAWHKTEEFQLDRWPQSDVQALLVELRQLAERAEKSHRPLLLFMSL